MGITLQYCSSAVLGYTRLSQSMKLPEMSPFAVDCFKHIDNNVSSSISFLYNAFTETEHGKHYDQLKEHGFDFLMYTDSGGLQVVTLGKDIESSKPAIFKAQSESDYCMAIDKMPLHIDGEKSAILDPHNRYFVIDKVADAGAETGRNVKEAIEYFKEHGSKAQIMPIIQGYTVETYVLYAKALFEQLNEDDYEYLGGIAIANTLNIGFFHAFDIMVQYQYVFDFIPERLLKHVHLLGIGALQRMLPFVVGLHNENIFKYKDFVVNYDSTSHTSCAVFGQFQYKAKNGKLRKTKLGYERNKQVDVALAQIYEVVKEPAKKHFGVNTLDEFIEQLTIYGEHGKQKQEWYKENNREDDYLRHLVFYFTMYIQQLMLFLEYIDEIKAHPVTSSDLGPLVNMSQFDRDLANFCKVMLDVKSYEDYLSHRKYFLKILGDKKKAINLIEDMNVVHDKNAVKDLF